MSNVFAKGTAPFYSVPQDLVASGKLKNLREGAHKLYQLILYKAQQRTKVALELSNREIRDLAGLSPNTVRRARIELWEVGLVELRQVPGGRYTYVVLNPLNRAPLAHPRPVLGGSSSSTPSTPTPSAASFAPPWSQIGK
jgi:hypothetical protein